MMRWLGSFNLAIFVAVSSLAAGPGPQVTNFNDKVSIDADGITLGSLLRLWDQATGMQSRVPPELANSIVSVRFSGLSVNDAVRTMFEKLPFDYVFIESHGIFVTGPALADAGVQPAPAEAAQEITDERPVEQPAEQAFVPPPRRPPVIPTPFGPMIDTARSSIVHLPPVYGEVPSPPFFAPIPMLTPPAGAPNGPAENNLFAPISIYGYPSPAPLARPGP
jgi:hypothetical protein